MRIIRNLVILLIVVLAGIWVWARILVAGLPVEPLGTFAEVKGERMHYVDQGQGSPILMIHGASGNLGDMELRLAPALRAAGGDVPDWLDPLDLPAWLETILAYAHPSNDGPDPRAAQLERMAGWHAPRWEDHFTKVDEVLRAVAP